MAAREAAAVAVVVAAKDITLFAVLLIFLAAVAVEVSAFMAQAQVARAELPPLLLHLQVLLPVVAVAALVVLRAALAL
jgi:hypothetical protein